MMQAMIPRLPPPHPFDDSNTGVPNSRVLLYVLSRFLFSENSVITV